MNEMPRTADSTLLSRLAGNFGRIIQEKELSGRQLAAKAGVSHSIVAHLLREEREPSLSTIEKLCEALEVELVDVVRDLLRRPRAAV